MLFHLVIPCRWGPPWSDAECCKAMGGSQFWASGGSTFGGWSRSPTRKKQILVGKKRKWPANNSHAWFRASQGEGTILETASSFGRGKEKIGGQGVCSDYEDGKHGFGEHGPSTREQRPSTREQRPSTRSWRSSRGNQCSSWQGQGSGKGECQAVSSAQQSGAKGRPSRVCFERDIFGGSKTAMLHAYTEVRKDCGKECHSILVARCSKP